MSLLPTAHAGQAFGARRIDFFTVSGDVVAADAASGRVRDDDGVDHDIRLLERAETLGQGDNATVLRVQAGPNRRSRPAAVINHSRNTWVRTAPGATGLLARSGVTRGINWWLSVLAIAITAIASVWPLLHAFLGEMNGAMLTAVPVYDVFAEINMLIPSLAGWRLENSLSTGLLDTIAGLNLVATEQLTEWGLAAGGLVLGAAAYFARSWRLIYVPVFAGFALAAGTILGGPEATLILCGSALVLFLLGGLMNRIRDAGRFNARIERLAEHVLRNPPQEGIRTGGGAAAAAGAIAAVAAVAERSGDDAAHLQTDAAEAARSDAGETDAAPAAAPGDDAANGEVEAGPSLELPPADNEDTATATASQSAAPEASGEAEAAQSEAVEPDPDAGAEPAAADAEQAGPSQTDDTEVAMAAVAAAMQDGNDKPAEAAAASDDEEDLPSLEAVAAAAALNAAERETVPDADPAEPSVPAAGAVEDDRTMPLAPPPPMPLTSAPVPPEAAAADAGAEPTAGEAAGEEADEPAGAAPADPSSGRLAEVETRVEAAVDAASRKSESLVDDPLMDDGPDPMLPKTNAGDFAPGAPDLEVERDPAD